MISTSIDLKKAGYTEKRKFYDQILKLPVMEAYFLFCTDKIVKYTPSLFLQYVV